MDIDWYIVKQFPPNALLILLIYTFNILLHYFKKYILALIMSQVITTLIIKQDFLKRKKGSFYWILFVVFWCTENKFWMNSLLVLRTILWIVPVNSLCINKTIKKE